MSKPSSRIAGIAGALLLFAAASLCALPARALTADDSAAIAQADSYLNQVTTLKAHFLQVAQNGATAEGTVYLSRPGKLRLEYQPPTPVLVVADGDDLIYYDKDLRQVSRIGLDSTMAGVLVAPRVHLDGGDLKVTAVTRPPGLVDITVTKRSDPHQGQITLVFTEKPFQLRQWRVVDQQGQTTTVSLYDAQTGMPLDSGLFQFRDPSKLPGTWPQR